jgi:hypothetical protein
MARTQHTYAKRQREIEKKRKADEKREKRRMKNQPAVADEETSSTDNPAENEIDNPATDSETPISITRPL